MALHFKVYTSTREDTIITTNSESDKGGSSKRSVKSSEYSGTSQSAKTAKEECMIGPEQAVSAGKIAQQKREARKKAKDGKTDK